GGRRGGSGAPPWDGGSGSCRCPAAAVEIAAAPGRQEAARAAECMGRLAVIARGRRGRLTRRRPPHLGGQPVETARYPGAQVAVGDRAIRGVERLLPQRRDLRDVADRAVRARGPLLPPVRRTVRRGAGGVARE